MNTYLMMLSSLATIRQTTYAWLFSLIVHGKEEDETTKDDTIVFAYFFLFISFLLFFVQLFTILESTKHNTHTITQHWAKQTHPGLHTFMLHKVTCTHAKYFYVSLAILLHKE